MKDIDPAALEQMRDAAKADLVAASLGEAVKFFIEAASTEIHHRKIRQRALAYGHLDDCRGLRRQLADSGKTFSNG